MHKFKSSIYTRPRARVRPSYNKTSWLDVVRAERRLDAKERHVEKIMSDMLARGVGVGMVHVENWN